MIVEAKLTTVPPGATLWIAAPSTAAADAVDDHVVGRAYQIDLGRDLVGAELAQPLGPARQPGYVRAGKLGELDREPPDAAARARDQHPLVEHEAADLERVQRGQPGHRQRGGLLERNRVGQLGQPFGADRGELRPGAGRHEADDAGARPGDRCRRRPLPDDAGEIPAGDRAGLERSRGAASRRG